MKRCWANVLGNCSDKITREHLVSQGLFTGFKVQVSGFSWCKESSKEVGLSSVVSKILCSKHNSKLSILDTTASNAFKTFREINRLGNVRKNLKKRHWNVKKYQINGILLERWFLKTTINICYKGEYIIGAKEGEPGIPNEKFVKIVFGLNKFPEERGLYNALYVGQQVKTGDVVSFQPIQHKEDKYIVGSFFSFYGYNFYLSLMPDPFTDSHKRFWGLGELDNFQLHYRMKKVDFLIGDRISQQLIYKWGGSGKK